MVTGKQIPAEQKLFQDVWTFLTNAYDIDGSDAAWEKLINAGDELLIANKGLVTEELSSKMVLAVLKHVEKIQEGRKKGGK